MKKMICALVMLLVFVVYASALAEEFTIHSGVKFGMTIEEVMQAEKEAGFEPEEITVDTRNCSAIHQKNGVFIEGQIAGVDGAIVTYHFDNEGKLDSTIYNLRGTYRDIEDSLIEKYGKIDESVSERIHDLRIALNLDVYNPIDELEESPVKVWIHEKCKESWIVSQDDGSKLIITLYAVEEEIKAGATLYFSYVGYQYYEPGEIEKVLAAADAAEAAEEAAKAADEENRSNQRDNDL